MADLNTNIAADLAYMQRSLRLNACPQAQLTNRRIRANAGDVNVFVGGDSTGDGTDRFVYVSALTRFAWAPWMTVKYRAWNSGTLTWGAPVTLQVGTGAWTITVWNASVSGTSLEYYEAANRAVVLGAAPAYFDEVTLNSGINSGTNVGEREYISEMRVAVSLAHQMVRDGGVMICLQIPQRYPYLGDADAGYNQSKRMNSAWATVAAETGCGIVDFAARFEEIGPIMSAALDPYYSDLQHPSALGTTLMVAAYLEATREDAIAARWPMIPSQRNISKPNLCPNPGFSVWPLGATAPTGWTFTNATPTKNTAEARGSARYALTAKITGNAPAAYCNLASLLPDLRAGETITMHARVKKPSGMDALAGRVDLYANNGSLTPEQTSYQRGTSSGDYYDSIVSFTVPRDPSYNSLTAKIFLGAGAGDVGKEVSIQWVSIHRGQGPNAFDPAWVAGQDVFDLFDSHAVGSSSGTVAVNDNDISVTALTTTTYAVYHNLTGLVVGRQYRATWGAITGTGFTFGTVYIQTGFGPGGGGSNLASASSGAGTATFTATSATCVWRLDVNGGTTAISVADLSITLVAEPLDLPSSTLALLPPAATYPGRYITVTNASGGPTLCRSDGTNWKVMAAQGATVA